MNKFIIVLKGLVVKEREREGKRQIRTNKKREENKNHIRNQNLHLRFSYRKGNVKKNTEEFDKQKW